MALSVFQFKPGIYADQTDYAAEGAYVDSNLIRFIGGLPETVGGWQKFVTATMDGVPRKAHAWAQLDGERLVAVGTHQKLQVVYRSEVYDITPVRDTGTLTDPFSTTTGSAEVTVAHTAHGLRDGDTVEFSGATAVGDVDPNGAWNVVVLDADSYSFTAEAVATSTATGGGTGTWTAYVHVGPASATPGYGWSAGGWSMSGWGTPRTSSGVTIRLGTWTMDNWGEDLLACPRGGRLCHWDASAGAMAPAAEVAAAPTAAAIVVDADARMVIALGADGDPMKVKWCDREDFTNWTAGATTTADERLLLDGSRLIAGQRTTGEVVLWTDTALYAMQYVGGAFIYNLRRVGDSGGLIGPHAKCEVGGAVYWMGQGQFYVYGGRIQHVPCTVRRTVFDRLDMEQAEKIHCGVNEAFQEIWWLYPSKDGSGEVDSYAKLHYPSGTWDVGTLPRSAWVPAGVYDTPLALTPDGTLYTHEVGNEADGAPLPAFIESADVDLGDGEEVMFINRMIPDFVLTGAADVTLKYRQYPADDMAAKGPFRIDGTTRRINPRVRGRQVAVRVETPSDAASFWRLGKLRFDAKPNGRR